MSPSRGPVRRSAVALLIVAGLAALLFPVPAGAGTASPRTYPGPAYSGEPAVAPTGATNQSKLWFYAGAWWALMLEPTGRSVRVFELLPDHTWRPTSAVVNPDAAGGLGDALPEGDLVHVVTRRRDESLYYVRLTFDARTRDYRADPSRLVTTRGSLAPATIARDTTGRLWIAYAASVNVVVTSSADRGRSWGRMNVLAATGTGDTQEVAALVAFDNRIGILWSDRRAGAVEFASHRDGDPDDVWRREVALAGPGRAGDRISLKRVRSEPSDTLVAAVQTSPGNGTGPQDSTLIEVLVRAPDGRWSEVPVSTVADGLDSPIVAVDEVNRTLHLFAAAGDDIVTKRASLDDLRFEPGRGDLFVLGAASNLTDPTAGKEPVDSETGLVVLASGTEDRRYRHAELPIPDLAPAPDPADDVPPTMPAGLRGHAVTPGTVALSWEASTDGDRWSPAADGVPVRGYVVTRDGVELGIVTSTSYGDTPRDPSAATAALPVEYSVQALDQAGNRSPAAGVVVVLPAAGDRTPLVLAGAGLLVIGALAAARAARSRPVALR